MKKGNIDCWEGRGNCQSHLLINDLILNIFLLFLFCYGEYNNDEKVGISHPEIFYPAFSKELIKPPEYNNINIISIMFSFYDIPRCNFIGKEVNFLNQINENKKIKKTYENIVEEADEKYPPLKLIQDDSLYTDCIKIHFIHLQSKNEIILTKEYFEVLKINKFSTSYDKNSIELLLKLKKTIDLKYFGKYEIYISFNNSKIKSNDIQKIIIKSPSTEIQINEIKNKNEEAEAKACRLRFMVDNEKNYKDSILYGEAILKSVPDLKIAHIYTGKAYENLNNKEKAYYHYLNGVEIFNDEKGVYELLYVSYKRKIGKLKKELNIINEKV